MRALGFALVAAGFVLFGLRKAPPQSSPARGALAIAGLASVWLGKRAMRLGKRYEARLASDAAARALGPFLQGLSSREPRTVRTREHDRDDGAALPRLSDDERVAPVLYLRSFADDPEGAEIRNHGALYLMYGPWAFFMLLTEEEQVAKVLSEFGPVLAVGKPGEPLPEIGAARLYLSDGEWQAGVRRLMRVSRLVVVRAGLTEGIWWELKEVVQLVQPDRLLILVPYRRAEYDAFRSRASRILPMGLPEMPRGGGVFSSLRGLIHFGPDWCATFVPLRRNVLRIWLSEPLVVVLKVALEKFARRLDSEWPVPPLRALNAFLLLSGLAFAVVMLLTLLGLGRSAAATPCRSPAVVRRGEQVDLFPRQLGDHFHLWKVLPVHLGACQRCAGGYRSNGGSVPALRTARGAQFYVTGRVTGRIGTPPEEADKHHSVPSCFFSFSGWLTPCRSVWSGASLAQGERGQGAGRGLIRSRPQKPPECPPGVHDSPAPSRRRVHPPRQERGSGARTRRRPRSAGCSCAPSAAERRRAIRARE